MRNVKVKVDKFVFPIDMLVMEIDNPRECEIILGRSFLATAQALIDVEQGELILRSDDDYLSYNVADKIAGWPSLVECCLVRRSGALTKVALKKEKKKIPSRRRRIPMV